MKVDVVTLFPELFEGFWSTSFIGRAREGGQLVARTRSPREFGLGKHRNVDDTPYGGGSGMVMRVDCLVACMESLDETREPTGRSHRILLTPQGTPFHQRTAARLSKLPALTLVCGRYEGFDERVRTFVDEEISLGDFVLTGGEIPAMAIIEAVIRLVPGVLGNESSTSEESHSDVCDGLLEYPQYTRPASFRDLDVPEVLKNGNHEAIAKWRRAEQEKRTQERRPDLMTAARERRSS